MSTGAKVVHPDGHEQARLHAALRFAVGVSAAFVLCEFMQWWPSFLAPVLMAALLANLPMRPPMKMALGLVAVMSFAALFAFVLASLLRGTPTVLFGAISLCMLLCFHAMLGGKPRLPLLLMLICLATIPVVAMIAPAQAGILPIALIRGMVIALLVIQLVHLAWPVMAAPAPAEPAARVVDLLGMALVSTAVVVPLMLVYLLFGLADALPVLVATVLLVVNFDLQRSHAHASAMIVGNLLGGLLGLLMHAVLLTTPTLPFLAVLLFLVLLGFGRRIAAGGPAAAIALLACNAMLIIFSLAIASGPGSLAVWLTRLFQFVLAGAFAIGMMTLFWDRTVRQGNVREGRDPVVPTR